MARDYVARNRKPAPKRAGLPGWVWLCAGLSIGLAVAAWVYISRPAQPLPMAQAPVAGDATAAGKRPKVEIPPKQDSRFKFYDLLESQQVIVPSDEQKKAAPTTPSSDDAQYLIIVASFQDPAKAEEQKASLAMAGVESRVEKVTVDDRETWYRVRVGPEKGLAKAQTVLSQLKVNGIEGRLVRMP